MKVYTTEDACSCGSVQTMSHLLDCAHVPRCSPEDLAEATVPHQLWLVPDIGRMESEIAMLRTRKKKTKGIASAATEETMILGKVPVKAVVTCNNLYYPFPQ